MRQKAQIREETRQFQGDQMEALHAQSHAQVQHQHALQQQQEHRQQSELLARGQAEKWQQADPREHIYPRLESSANPYTHASQSWTFDATTVNHGISASMNAPPTRAYILSPHQNTPAGASTSSAADFPSQSPLYPASKMQAPLDGLEATRPRTTFFSASLLSGWENPLPQVTVTPQRGKSSVISFSRAHC